MFLCIKETKGKSLKQVWNDFGLDYTIYKREKIVRATTYDINMNMYTLSSGVLSNKSK